MWTRLAYYEEMKALAREVRLQHGLTSAKVTLTDMRGIYKAEDIHIDLWPPKDTTGKLKKLRGAYFCDELGPTVLVDRNLPEEPRIFTMGHELKHHLADRNDGMVHCSSENVETHIEVGAEVFAAELIFPEDMFADAMRFRGIEPGQCTAEALVRLKRESETTMSYAALVKRAENLRYAAKGAFANVQFKKLEEQIYGIPYYKLNRRN